MALKDDFRRGCESGGGSFVENPDGSYQCNTTSGIVIRCRADGQRCWIAAQIAEGVNVDVDVAPVGIRSIFDMPVATGPLNRR